MRFYPLSHLTSPCFVFETWFNLALCQDYRHLPPRMTSMFISKFNLVIFNQLCMYVCTCVQVLGGLDPLKLKSQAVVNLVLNMDSNKFFLLTLLQQYIHRRKMF